MQSRDRAESNAPSFTYNPEQASASDFPLMGEDWRLDNDELLSYSEEALLSDDFHGKLKPILDIVFVRLFDQENDHHLLKTFLNDFLKLPDGARITSVERLHTRMTGDHAGEKEPVMDLLVRDQSGRRLHIELQLGSQPDYLNRAIYYGARIYSAQLQSGEDYHALKQTICIHILAWNLFVPEKEWAEYVTPVKLCEVGSGRVVSEQLQYWFVELRKFKGEQEGLHERREKWLYFLKNGDKVGEEQLRRLGMRELLEANEKLVKISRDKDMRLAYLGKMKAEHDAINFRNGYLREGFEKGLETGKDLGRAEGLELGVEKGILQERRRLILRLVESRLGSAPESIQTKLETVSSPEHLERLLEASITIPSWDALRELLSAG